ncbi:MAG TPA: serine/threonine-protein kinase [Vicinamibacterales bacterium]|nr:serine/threonine-protein kinase [Vicinamibacterales bacterium]
MSPEPSSGRRSFSHYEILAPLGKGGMGEVYVAFDTTLQRKVALKAVRQDRRLDDEARARLLREARILSQLDHPGICRVYDYVSDEGTDYLVLELIEGESLRDAMRRPLPQAAKMPIADQVAQALVVAHAAGIIHRDLKPENIMLLPDGSAKVLDFGLARSFEAPVAGGAGGPRVPATIGAQFDSASETIAGSDWKASGAGSPVNTVRGVLLGSPGYMSPEQAAGEPATSQSDMYAFGLLLQELFTGVSAYDLSTDLPTLLEHARSGKTRELTGVGRDLADLIARLKSVAPSQRPTALDAMEWLRRIREKPARRLRYGLVAALLLIAAAGAVKYTIDLERERTAAVLAREDANRRREQAEGLIGFMLGDLRSKLQRVGRLDVLDDVGGRAMAYFAAVPPADLTDEELFRRSQAVHQIGQVRMARGDLKGAAAMFAESLDLVTSLAVRSPANADWQVGLATSHFYVGDALRLQGDLDGAMRHFSAYRDIAAALVNRDAKNPEWLLELSYGHSNVAAVLEARGDLEGARAELSNSLDINRRLLALKSDNREWQEALATVHNRLAVVLEKMGDPRTALDHHLEDFAVRKALLDRHPHDATARRKLADAASYVGLLYRDGGDDARALEYHQLRLATLEALVARDPANADWQRELGIAEVRMATVQRLRGDLKDAAARAERAARILRALAGQDPAHTRRQRDAADAEVELAAVHLESRQTTGALGAASRATTALDALLQKNPNDVESRRLLAEAHLGSAEALARQGAHARAKEALERARAALEERASTVRERRFQRTWALVLRGLGRSQEAEAVAARLRDSGFRPFTP